MTKIWPSNLLDLLACNLLLCVICLGTLLILPKLRRPVPPPLDDHLYPKWYAKPEIVEPPAEYIWKSQDDDIRSIDSIECVVGADDSLTVRTPEEWMTCAPGLVTCATTHGARCTRTGAK